MTLLADHNAASHIVIGAPIADWWDPTSADFEVAVEVEGDLLHSIPGEPALANALSLLGTFLRGADNRIESLPSGSLITTGSIIPPLRINGVISADFAKFGKVALSMTV